MTMVKIVCILAVLMSISGCSSSKSSSMTFNEFKEAIDWPNEYSFVLDTVYAQVGKPDKVQFLDGYVYMYWTVQDGTVMMTGFERGGKFLIKGDLNLM